jgi:hypothetical protein
MRAWFEGNVEVCVSSLISGNGKSLYFSMGGSRSVVESCSHHNTITYAHGTNSWI